MLTTAILALYSLSVPQGSELVDRDYDLSALWQKSHSEALSFRPDQAFSYSKDRAYSDGDDKGVFSFDRVRDSSSAEEWVGTLMDLFQESFEAEGGDFRMSVRERGAVSLFVRASENVHRDVQENLDQILIAATSGAQLTLEVFRLPADAPTQLLENGFASHEELEQLRAQVRPVVHSCFVPRHGLVSRSDASTQDMIVGYLTQIASQSFMHYPLRVQRTEGMEFVAGAGRVPGGYWMTLGLQHCHAPSPIQSRTMKLDGLLGSGEDGEVEQVRRTVVLDQADVGVNAFAMDSFVPDGGALTFGARSTSASGDPVLWLYAVNLVPVGPTEDYIELSSGNARLHLIDGGATSMGTWSEPRYTWRLKPSEWDTANAREIYRTATYNGYAELADARMIDGWVTLHGNPADSEHAAERLEVLAGMRAAHQRLARRSPVLALGSVLSGNEKSALWMPIGGNGENFALTGRFGMNQYVSDAEVATAAAANEVEALVSGAGLMVGARSQTLGANRITTLSAVTRLGVSGQQRAELSDGDPVSELFSASEASYAGQVIRPLGAPRSPIAGGAGGEGAVIEMRMIE